MKFFQTTAAFGILFLVFSCNSDVDQSLLGEMTSAAVQLEDQIGQTSTAGENLAKFRAVLDRAPDALKADTSAHFSAFMENYDEIAGQQSAVNAQLNDMKIRLTVMMGDYSAGKLKTDVARAEFGNFSASLTNIGESISSFASDYGKLQVDYGKMMADFNMKKEEGETKTE